MGGNLKKVLALVLTLAMMLSVMVMNTGAAFTDDADINSVHTEAVDACVALQILNGFTDGSFQPNGDVTRAQMCKMCCVAMNGGKVPALSASATSSFTDVAVDNWASPYIEACVSQGIVAGIGGGKFNPTGQVTGTQAAKMLLIALGYDATVEGLVGAGWDVKTNVLATQNGLYDELEDIDVSAALTREHAAQMIWNCLQAKEVEYDYTLVTDANGNLTSSPKAQKVGPTALADWYAVSKYEAVVLANEFGRVDEGQAIQKEGKACLSITSIDDKAVGYGYIECFDVATDLDMLGQSVVLFVKDGKTVVGEVVLGEDNVVVATAEEQTHSDLVDLLDDADLELDTGATGTKFVENYKAAAASTVTAASVANPTGVALTAIDNNDDGKVDYVIQVYSYLGEVTKYSTSDKGSITVKTCNGNVKYDDSSKVVGFEDVAKDDYVVVSEIGDKLFINKAETVVGSLTAYKTGSSLTVDGQKYNVVTFAANESVDTTEFKAPGSYGGAGTLDKEATFYLDNNGNILAVGSVEGAVDDYAYVWAIEQGKFKGAYEVKVTLSDGTTGEYVLSDKAGTIGATMENKSPISYTATNTAAYPNGVPVERIYTYSINSSDEIVLEEIASGINNNDGDATAKTKAGYTFDKGKATITSVNSGDTATQYGDADTVFFNVKYKTDGKTIDKVDVYTGIANAPSMKGNFASIFVSDGGTMKAVATKGGATAANGDYLYLYGYQGTNGDGDYYRAVVGNTLMDADNGLLYTDSTASTKTANGVYEYTVNADGLYQIKSAPQNVASGVISKISGDSIIMGGVEYTVSEATNVATIDGDDTTVGDTLAKNDYVVLVYDVNGSDKDVTGAFILANDVGAAVKASSTDNGSTGDIAMKAQADGLYIPSARYMGDMGNIANTLIFKFTTKVANTETVLTITNDATGATYTESWSSFDVGGHYFYVDTKAGTDGVKNSGTDGTGSEWTTKDAPAGRYTYTVVEGTTTLLEGAFYLA